MKKSEILSKITQKKEFSQLPKRDVVLAPTEKRLK
jgi:hypothetical protein